MTKLKQYLKKPNAIENDIMKYSMDQIKEF